MSLHYMDYIGMPKRTPDYLRFPYAAVHAGYVAVGAPQLTYLIIHHILARFEVTIPERIPGWIRRAYGAQVSRLTKEIGREKQTTKARRNIGAQHESSYPPCIRSYLQRIRGGEVLEHYPNYNLVAFLGYYGMEKEKIIQLFEEGHKERFNRRLTMYQVNHILREDSDDKDDEGYEGYYTMSCRQMRDLGICPSSQCDGPTPIVKYAKTVRANSAELRKAASQKRQATEAHA